MTCWNGLDWMPIYINTILPWAKKMDIESKIPSVDRCILFWSMATDEALYFTDSNGDGTYLIFILEIESSHVFQILPKLITNNLLVDSMSAVSQSRRKIFQHVPYYFCYWWVVIWPNAFSPFWKVSFFFLCNESMKWEQHNNMFFFIILEEHLFT